MPPKALLCLALFLGTLVAFSWAKSNNLTESASNNRKAKFSVFNIVRFPNDPCDGSGNRNGTCYTEQECENRDGSNAGSCANGYGVCCVFTLGCGDMSKENCTYFESSNHGGGVCRASICMTSSEICQLRLDFNTFVITGPTTSTTSAYKTIAGTPLSVGTKFTTPATQCNTDSFTVTNPGGEALPVICGTNTGEHMYLPASDACNDLVFQMNDPLNTDQGTPAAVNLGTAINGGNRRWSIKITQIACNDINKAPIGCTQYYYGGTQGFVQTFNYDGGSHLANQNQNICIRRERGNCRICWSADNTIDVMLSSMTASGFVKVSSCCGYGSNGQGTKGYDCLIIPGAFTNAEQTFAFAQCGRSAGLVKSTGTTSVTVCSDRVPFNIRFLSDEFEFDTEAAKNGDVGFRLRWWQTSNGC